MNDNKRECPECSSVMFEQDHVWVCAGCGHEIADEETEDIGEDHGADDTDLDGQIEDVSEFEESVYAEIDQQDSGRY